MKYFLFILSFLFIFPFCIKDFDVIEATSQKWTGGTPDSGKGTNYAVTMLAKTNNENLQIDQLWIGDNYYEVQAYKRTQNRRDTSFVKNDTIFIQANLLFQPDQKGVMLEVKNYENIEKPYNYNGEALIGYYLKGKRKYKEIEKLKQLKYIPYP